MKCYTILLYKHKKDKSIVCQSDQYYFRNNKEALVYALELFDKKYDICNVYSVKNNEENFLMRFTRLE